MGPGVELLQTLGVAVEQESSPEVARVESWNAAGVDAASLYKAGLMLPWRAPSRASSRAATPAIEGADAEVPEKATKPKL